MHTKTITKKHSLTHSHNKTNIYRKQTYSEIHRNTTQTPPHTLKHKRINTNAHTQIDINTLIHTNKHTQPTQSHYSKVDLQRHTTQTHLKLYLKSEILIQ